MVRPRVSFFDDALWSKSRWTFFIFYFSNLSTVSCVFWTLFFSQQNLKRNRFRERVTASFGYSFDACRCVNASGLGTIKLNSIFVSITDENTRVFYFSHFYKVIRTVYIIHKWFIDNNIKKRRKIRENGGKSKRRKKTTRNRKGNRKNEREIEWERERNKKQ